MNLLDQVLNVSPTDPSLSDAELKIVNEILKEVNVPLATLDSVIRINNDFFYTSYLISYDKGNIFVKISPNNLFGGEAKVSYWRGHGGRPPFTALSINTGQVGSFYYSVSSTPHCFPMSTAKYETLISALDYFAGMLLVAHSYPQAGLPNQRDVYEYIFSFNQFAAATPDEFLNRLYKRYPTIQHDLLDIISSRAKEFFFKYILDKHKDIDSMCVGPLRTQDVVMEDKSALPMLLFYPHIMAGNRIVDAACFPRYFNLPVAEFNKSFSLKNKQIFIELDKLAPYAWITDFYLTLIDECMLSTIGTSFHNTGRLSNSAKYQSYRGWISNSKEFKEFTVQLDAIFLEKLIK